MNLLNFLFDAPYEERKVARDDFPWGMVSTAAVNDGREPYETGISHPDYNEGHVIIVEAYSTRGKAKAGHARWVATMTAKRLPAKLVDCANAEVCQLLQEVTGEPIAHKRARKRS